MWRKYRESFINKNLQRIKGRKTSLIYQNQVLTVQQIFAYNSNKRTFYHFYVKGNLPQIYKNKRKSQFLAIELSRGSSILLSYLIREVLRREGSKRFFFIQYPLYPQSNIQYLLLLLHIQEDQPIEYFEKSLREIHDEFTQVIHRLTEYGFKNPLD